MLVTRRPVTPWMVERTAKALWDRNRKTEGRVEWDAAERWVTDPWRLTAADALEAALPSDPKLLREIAKECNSVADII